MAKRIYRRCPSCGAVRAASEFPRAGRQDGAWGSAWRIRCPGCGHSGSLMAFPRVDPPAEHEGGSR